MQKHGISSLQELSQKAKNDLEWFWDSVDHDIGIVWDKQYTKILDASKGIAWSKWFVNGKTNIYKSSVEKFTKQNPQKIAYYFVSEDGCTSKISYSELDSKVSKLANGLKSLGVKKGDVVAIYLPMIEEAILAILAASKIGAIQTTIFSGYSSQSLHMRLQDCKAKILFISDGFYRTRQPAAGWNGYRPECMIHHDKFVEGGDPVEELPRFVQRACPRWKHVRIGSASEPGISGWMVPGLKIKIHPGKPGWIDVESRSCLYQKFRQGAQIATYNKITPSSPHCWLPPPTTQP